MTKKRALACVLLALGQLCTNNALNINLDLAIAGNFELNLGEILAVAAGFLLLRR